MPKLKYLNGVISLLKWSVLYPIDNTNPRSKKILHFFWSFIFVSSFVITVAQGVVHLIVTPFNLVEQSMVVMNTGIYMTLFMNFGIFYYHSDNLVNLVNNINENFVDHSDNGLEDITMQSSAKLSDKLVVYWTVSLIASCLLSAVQPLIIGERTLPVPGWLPYDYTRSPLYELSYAWQTLCQINLAIIYASSDMIYPCMTILIGQQFKILSSNFKNHFYHAILQCGVPKQVVLDFRDNLHQVELSQLWERFQTVFDVTKWNRFRRVNLDYFKRNITHHQRLLIYCEDLDRVMSLFLLTKVVAAFCNVTFIGFSLITTGNSALIMGLCSYVFFASTELFVYTYAGQILTQNADFLWSLYESPWYLCDVPFQKLFLMVQLRKSKVVCTRAGNYFAMTAPMFISFMRSAFSYVALLNELVKSDRV